MKRTMGKILTALLLSIGMIGVAAHAHAAGYTMVPASSGSPAYSGSVYWASSSVTAYDPGGMTWYIPVPNNTGLTGGNAYIDMGPCTGCYAQGIATDDHGNYEAVTNVVYPSTLYPTSLWAGFGAGFVKTGYTYVSYYISLQQYAIVNGIEYYQN